ncbi:MAG: hypothetical protein WJ306_05230 [Ferrovum myxofaciens]|uniref:Uncharacterized protein n=1 Tax=mine drainage metagenome TaxID=410659 RepID=A0A3P3ZL69_9ZZZZ
MHTDKIISIVVQLQDRLEFNKAYDTWRETLGDTNYSYPAQSAGQLRNGRIEGVTYSAVPKPFLDFLDSKVFRYEVL